MMPLALRGLERLGDLAGEGERPAHGEADAGPDAPGSRLACARQDIREGGAVHQLEDEGRNLSRLLKSVDCADAGMVQGREKPRFTFEPRQPGAIGPNHCRQDLDRNIPPQLGIARTVHFAHPAGAEPRVDTIHADMAPDQRAARVLHQDARLPDRGAIQETVGCARFGEE